MTNNQRKQFDKWAVGTVDNETIEGEIEFDVVKGLDAVPRVRHLKSLGYKIDSWQGYAWAELNESMKEIV